MNLIASYLSGVISSFSPCIAVLIPLIFYKFYKKEDKQYFKLLLFVLGFIVSYLFFSLILGQFFTSSLQNGFKLGFGILFVSLGLLTYFNKINPLNIPVANNPFIAGISFSLIASFSPCTIPYLSVLITGKFSSVSILFFGLGILSPAILFSIIGQSILEFAKKKGKVLHNLNKLMSIVLVASGIYLASSIKSFGKFDAYIVGLLLAFVFIILLKAFFIVDNVKDLFRIKNIILFSSLILIIAATILHCTAETHNNMDKAEEQNQFICMEHGECEICKRCTLIFGVAAVLGFVGVTLGYKKHRK